MYNVEKIRIYCDNEVQTEFHYDRRKDSNSNFRENVHPKWRMREIDYIEISLEGCLSEIVVLEIFLKNF
jgi:hypothetical protein